MFLHACTMQVRDADIEHQLERELHHFYNAEKLTLPGGSGSCGGAEKFSGCCDITGYSAAAAQTCKTDSTR